MLTFIESMNRPLEKHLLVREMTIDEIDIRIDYFLSSSTEHLELMGVERTNLPSKENWLKTFQENIEVPIRERTRVDLIWMLNGSPIGMSSLDNIQYAQEAYMHLHIFDASKRLSGLGSNAVTLSTSFYFNELQLKHIYCQPNAFNTAPNRTLQKAGFKFVKTYMTIPGPMNNHQAVTLWKIDNPAYA